MAVFEYKGLDATRKAVSGIVDADNPKAARAQLRHNGVFVSQMHEQVKGRLTRGSGLNIEIDFAQYLEFVSPRDVAILTTQLSTLVGASIPMVEALTALVDQAEKQKLKVVLSQVKEGVNEGATLADAMSHHPKVFNDLYVQMVRAGESSGSLDEVLNRLAAYTDSQVKLQGQVLAALTYPVLMSMVGAGIMIGLFVGVVPRVRSLFDGLGGEEALPLLTRLVFGFGDVLLGYFWVPFLVIPMLVLVFRRWHKSVEGRYKFDLFRLKVPIIGSVHRLVAVSRFCRTLATLLVSGVPIIQALNIGQRVIGNVVMAEAVSEAAVNIQEGQSIAAPLKKSGHFPPVVTHMIAIGERTGELERMLTVVSDAYDSQVEARLNAMTSLLGPLVILAMGGTVFVIAIALLMPMMNLSQMIT
jgi:general secretion pathway protein F